MARNGLKPMIVIASSHFSVTLSERPVSGKMNSINASHDKVMRKHASNPRIYA